MRAVLVAAVVGVLTLWSPAWAVDDSLPPKFLRLFEVGCLGTLGKEFETVKGFDILDVSAEETARDICDCYVAKIATRITSSEYLKMIVSADREANGDDELRSELLAGHPVFMESGESCANEIVDRIAAEHAN